MEVTGSHPVSPTQLEKDSRFSIVSSFFCDVPQRVRRRTTPDSVRNNLIVGFVCKFASKERLHRPFDCPGMLLEILFPHVVLVLASQSGQTAEAPVVHIAHKNFYVPGP